MHGFRARDGHIRGRVVLGTDQPSALAARPVDRPGRPTERNDQRGGRGGDGGSEPPLRSQVDQGSGDAARHAS